MDIPIGFKHYDWTVIRNKVVVNRRGYYRCLCICGVEKDMRSDYLLRDDYQSCGCRKKDVQRKRLTKHGHTTVSTSTPTYGVWESMHGRCRNKNHKAYKDYGGKGIAICNEWYDFANFLIDMGGRPSDNLSLDRIDSAKGYNKHNCKWSTRAQQNRNYSTKSVYYEFSGIRLIQKDWARMFGIAITTIARWVNIDHLSMGEIAAKAKAKGKWDGKIDYGYLANYNQYENSDLLNNWISRC